MLATLNGLRVPALIDTGAGMPAIGHELAETLHVGPAELLHDPQVVTRGLGPNSAVSHVHHFDTLDLGGISIPRPAVVVSGASISGKTIFGHGDESWMIVGGMALSTRRVWIDYPGAQILFGPED